MTVSHSVLCAQPSDDVVIDDVVVLTDDDVTGFDADKIELDPGVDDVIGFDADKTELDPDVDVVPLHQLGVQKSVVKSNRTGWINITADRTMNF